MTETKKLNYVIDTRGRRNTGLDCVSKFCGSGSRELQQLLGIKLATV